MKKLSDLTMGLFFVLGVYSFSAPQDKLPEIIRISLTRSVNAVYGVGMGLSFDEEEVAKALSKTAVKLPSPLPAGARVGFNYEDDFYVIMEKIEGREAVYLTIDANMNRDLRDDARIEVPAVEKIEDAPVIRIKRTYPGNLPKEIWLPYRFKYSRTTNARGEISDRFFLSPAYRMDGIFQVQGQEYELQLSDFNILGMFDKSNLSRGTVLRIFPKGDPEKPDSGFWGYELIPLGDRFYEVKDGALDGSWIELIRNTLPQAAIGRPAPDFQLTDSEGKTFRLSDYKGRLLLLDFWPSWCVPCVGEFPNIKKTIQKYETKPLSVVGINLDSEKRLDMAKKVIAAHSLPWRQVLPGRGQFLPIYQVLGRLPEFRMAFPLYAAIDPEGTIRYATNDFRKMERFLNVFFADDPSRRETMFIPLSQRREAWKESAPVPVDFRFETLQAFLRSSPVKLPDGLPKEARVGRLPNGTVLVARPSLGEGRIFLLLDADRDQDLTNDEEKEIPVLERAPAGPEEGTSIEVTISYASGAKSFRPLRFFALPESAGADRSFPAIFFIGYKDSFSGSFFVGDEEYSIEITDPTFDCFLTDEDMEWPGFLTVKKKKGDQSLAIFSGTQKIPIGGRLYRLNHVHDDGKLIELVLEKRAD